MKDYYDVVVLGRGLAGLSAGAYMCKDGHSLLVCEQADQTGRYFRSFNTAGFVFEAGLKAVEDWLYTMSASIFKKRKLNKC